MTTASRLSRRDSDPGKTAVPLYLLTIDDDPAYRAYVSAIARRHGWVAQSAEDGEAALAILEHQRFDLLMVDYEMPRVNGMEFVARLRADEKLRNTYAVMFTARGDMETRSPRSRPVSTTSCRRAPARARSWPSCWPRGACWPGSRTSTWRCAGSTGWPRATS